MENSCAGNRLDHFEQREEAGRKGAKPGKVRFGRSLLWHGTLKRHGRFLLLKSLGRRFRFL
jgi:hypothetical protein